MIAIVMFSIGAANTPPNCVTDADCGSGGTCDTSENQCLCDPTQFPYYNPYHCDPSQTPPPPYWTIYVGMIDILLMFCILFVVRSRFDVACACIKTCSCETCALKKKGKRDRERHSRCWWMANWQGFSGCDCTHLCVCHLESFKLFICDCIECKKIRGHTGTKKYHQLSLLARCGCRGCGLAVADCKCHAGKCEHVGTLITEKSDKHSN